MASVLQTFSDDLASAVERAGRHIVAIRARRRIPSSGVLWRDGVVVSAQHTIHRDEDITVTLPDGSTSQATLVGRDAGTDLAALRLGSVQRTSIELAPAESIRIGGLVLALGRPGRDVTAALGIVSAAGGEWRTAHGGRIDRSIRLDVGVYDGFSGGPLVDPTGRVIGINTSGLLRGAPTTVPASTVNRVLDQLLEHGHIPTGYLGVALQAVRLPGDTERGRIGLMLVSVEPDSPAGRAGLLLGDAIVAIDDAPVSDPADILARLDGGSVGREMRFQVVRAAKPMSVTVTIGERPASARR